MPPLKRHRNGHTCTPVTQVNYTTTLILADYGVWMRMWLLT